MVCEKVFEHKDEACFPEMLKMAYLPDIILALVEHGPMSLEKLSSVMNVDLTILSEVLNNDFKSEFMEFRDASNDYTLTDFGHSVSEDFQFFEKINADKI